MARLPRGRRRIPIQKIEAQSNLEVTFSKRRNGVFTKASELSLLCHSGVAIVILSAENSIYAFGEPSVEQVLDTFMNENPYPYPYPQNSVVEHLMEDREDPELLCGRKEEEMVQYKDNIEVEKTRGKTITELANDPREEDNCLKKWWLTPVEDLTLHEAEKMLEELEEFEHSMDTHTETSSSSRQTNEVSPVVPCGGGFPDHSTPQPYLASTSDGLERSDKGKAPMQD